MQKVNRTPSRKGSDVFIRSVPPPKISHSHSSNNELNELRKNTWEAVMKYIN